MTRLDTHRNDDLDWLKGEFFTSIHDDVPSYAGRRGIGYKDRFNYFLNPLTGRGRKYDFVGFDVETIGDTNEFLTGGLYWYDSDGNEKFEYFEDKLDMCDYICSYRFKSKYIVATNLDFDFNALFWGTPHWELFDTITRGGTLLMASYKLAGENNGFVRLIDTMNYCYYGVKSLGEIIGCEKLSHPSFWLKDDEGGIVAIPPKNLFEAHELYEYNKRDCKISCDFMYFFLSGISKVGGNLKTTIASTALDTWRRGYLDVRLIKEEFFVSGVRDLIFSAYYGGRTEVFSRGKIEGFNYYDINSLYPSVMRNKYPLPNSVEKPVTPTLQNILDFDGVSDCLVFCPDMKFPLLPFRSDGKLLFPTGVWRSSYNHVELRKALDLGYVVVPLDQVIYTKSFFPFKKFMEHFYSERKALKSKGSNMQLVYKLLMNSLYGKFAQKRLESFDIMDFDSMSVEDVEKLKDLESSGASVDFKDGRVMVREESVCDSVFSFPILSSYTTSYARLLMYDYIVDLDVVYTDTDSVITKKYIGSSDVLGEMELEGTIDVGYLVKPKFYMLDGKPKIKGVRRPDEDDFLSLLRGEKVKKWKFSKLRESFRRGLSPNTRIDVEKSLSLEDNKRSWSGSFDPDSLQHSSPLFVGFRLVRFELFRFVEVCV